MTVFDPPAVAAVAVMVFVDGIFAVDGTSIDPDQFPELSAVAEALTAADVAPDRV